MKYNRVRMGDGVIVNEQKAVIHSLGILDWNIYNCISSNHITDEVSIGVQGVQTRLKRNVRFESK